MEQRREAIFRRSADLYSRLREAYRANESVASVLEEYSEAPFLVLDDLGAGSLSDHERRATLEVIDQRFIRCLPTVVTTNWTLQQIGEQMDDRIASRLALFKIIELTGPDRRLLQHRAGVC